MKTAFLPLSCLLAALALPVAAQERNASDSAEKEKLSWQTLAEMVNAVNVKTQAVNGHINDVGTCGESYKFRVSTSCVRP